MLKRSTVHRKLDVKFKIGGVEAADLLAVLIFAAVLNLFLSGISIGPIFIFGLPGILFAALYFGKRGKPSGFLMHAFKFYFSPGQVWAGEKEEN